MKRSCLCQVVITAVLTLGCLHLHGNEKDLYFQFNTESVRSATLKANGFEVCRSKLNGTNHSSWAPLYLRPGKNVIQISMVPIDADCSMSFQLLKAVRGKGRNPASEEKVLEKHVKKSFDKLRDFVENKQVELVKGQYTKIKLLCADEKPNAVVEFKALKEFDLPMAIQVEGRYKEDKGTARVTCSDGKESWIWKSELEFLSDFNRRKVVIFFDGKKRVDDNKKALPKTIKTMKIEFLDVKESPFVIKDILFAMPDTFSFEKTIELDPKQVFLVNPPVWDTCTPLKELKQDPEKWQADVRDAAFKIYTALTDVKNSAMWPSLMKRSNSDIAKAYGRDPLALGRSHSARTKKKIGEGWTFAAVKKEEFVVRPINDKTVVVTRKDGSPLYQFVPPARLRDKSRGVVDNPLEEHMYFGFLNGKWQYVK